MLPACCVPDADRQVQPTMPADTGLARTFSETTPYPARVGSASDVPLFIVTAFVRWFDNFFEVFVVVHALSKVFSESVGNEAILVVHYCPFVFCEKSNRVPMISV